MFDGLLPQGREAKVFGPNIGSTLILGGVAVAVLVGSNAFSYSQGRNAQDAKLGRNFEMRLAIERDFAIRREVNLWTIVGDERRARRELITTFLKIDEVSAEARAKYLAALQQEKAEAQAALDAAMRNIEELRNAVGEPVKNWRDAPIPPDVTCGVFNGKGCPDPAYPAVSADIRDGVEVRDAAAGEADGS
jgi:hypothetical protein